MPVKVEFTIGGDAKGGFIFKPLAGRATNDPDVSRRRRIKDEIAKAVANHYDEHGEALSLTAITKVVSGKATDVREIAKDLGHTPNSGFEIVTGQRNAVLLQPRKRPK